MSGPVRGRLRSYGYLRVSTDRQAEHPVAAVHLEDPLRDDPEYDERPNLGVSSSRHKMYEAASRPPISDGRVEPHRISR